MRKSWDQFSTAHPEATWGCLGTLRSTNTQEFHRTLQCAFLVWGVESKINLSHSWVMVAGGMVNAVTQEAVPGSPGFLVGLRAGSESSHQREKNKPLPLSSRVFLAKQRETFRQRVRGRRKEKPHLGHHIKQLTFCRAQRRVKSDPGFFTFFLLSFFLRTNSGTDI